MASPSGADRVHADLRRKFAAWRAALLGVRSPDAPRATPERPVETPVQTPAEQASFDLRRPRHQVWHPIIIGGLLSLYVLIFSAGAGAVAAAVTAAITVRRHRRQVRHAAGRALNSAFNLIGLGRLREASEVLDALEARVREPWALRLADIQRAIIAIRRGDMAPAEAHLTSAIERPTQAYARENTAYQLEGARALRAFVRASLGKHEEARADVAEVERGGPSEDARARVALAEAMILEQQGKREELRQLLAERGALLLEHTHPRERAIVRAFQRMVRAGKASVYRRAEAHREREAGEEPKLDDWVARVAPGAAEFVRSPRPAEQVAKIAPSDAVVRPTAAAVRANTEAKRPLRKGAVGWIAAAGAGMIFVTGVVALVIRGAFHALQGLPDAPDTGENVASLIGITLLAVPLFYGIARAVRWLMRRRAERDVRRAAKGTGARAAAPTEQQLRSLSESPSPVVAAQAALLLADQAERRGDFAAVLAWTTAGLARLADQRDRVAADIVYPDLLSLRAFALAAGGRYQESNAELATLGPTYPHHSRAVFRARLVMLVRSGDLRGAAHWVDQGEADLPLSVREELLADLVRAAARPEQAGAGEIQRLKDELGASPEAKAWIRVVAPGLLESFEGATMTDVQMRIDTSFAADHPAASEPEAERLAEEEVEMAHEAEPFAPAMRTL